MLPRLTENAFRYNHNVNKPLTHLVLEEAEPSNWLFDGRLSRTMQYSVNADVVSNI